VNDTPGVRLKASENALFDDCWPSSPPPFHALAFFGISVVHTCCTVVPKHDLCYPTMDRRIRRKSLNPNSRPQDVVFFFAKPLYGLTPVSRVRIPPSPPELPYIALAARLMLRTHYRGFQALPTDLTLFCWPTAGLNVEKCGRLPLVRDSAAVVIDWPKPSPNSNSSC